MIQRCAFLFVAFVALCLIACGPKAPTLAPMGDAAPAFGTGDKADLKSFLVGQWCLSGSAGTNPSRPYEFKSDGTFSCGGNNGEWKSTGTWTVAGDSANLAYTTMKGKSWNDYQAEYKKDEEGGGQIAIQRALFYDNLYQELGQMQSLWVDDDKKHLTFTDPKAAKQAEAALGGNADLGSLSDILKGKRGLERMGPKKE